MLVPARRVTVTSPWPAAAAFDDSHASHWQASGLAGRLHSIPASGGSFKLTVTVNRS